MKIAVIGGGVAGLSAAYRLLQQGHEVDIFEASPEVGGLVGTFDAGGERLERFYHHIFTTDTTIVDLIEELGLGERLQWYDSKVGFYHRGKVYDFVTPWDLLRFRPLPIWDRLRLGLAGLYLRRQDDWQRYESITAWEWIARYVGRKPLDVVWGPLLRGKFADQAEDVSMAWLWSKIHLRFASRQSGVSQREKLGYLDGSFAAYVEELVRRVRAMGARIETSAPVTRIVATEGRATSVVVGDEDAPRPADAIVAAVPSTHFLRMAPPLTEDYERRVRAARWQSALCYVLALREPLSRIYWLNISDAEIPFIAVVEHTNLIDRERYGGRHLVYISNYLVPDHEYLSMTPEQLDELYLPHLAKINPRFTRDWITDRWVFRAPNAQPVIRCNYGDDMPDHRTPVHGLYLANMQQIYPEDRGQNYSIRMGERVAAMIADDMT